MRTAALILVGLLAACGGTPTPNDPKVSPDVIERIETSESCHDLQGEFDRAEGFGNAAVMKLAEARRHEIGCYA